MASERQRLIQLALESLIHQRDEIDAEIAAIKRRMRGGRGPGKAASASGKQAGKFSRAEKMKRSQRMKAYWENWRKKNRK